LNLADSSITPCCSYSALNGTSIQIKNSVTTAIELELLPKTISNVTLHILDNNVLSYDLILGRDFLTNNNIFFTYTPLGEDLENRVQLFSEIATINVVELTSDKTTNILNDVTIDFDSDVKQQLINVFEQIENTNIPFKNDDYAVKVRLKNESTFVYSPRRFAYNEIANKRDNGRPSIQKYNSDQYVAILRASRSG